MAIKNQYALTLADILARRTPDGKFDKDIVDLTLQVNPLLDSIPFIEANGGIVHTTTLRTGAHLPTWIALGEGVQANKTATTQIKATCGLAESLVEIDGNTYEASLDFNGKATDATKALVQDEILAAVEGMKDEMAKTYIYGDISDEPRSFNGLGTVFAKYGVSNVLATNSSNDQNDASYYCINASKTSSPSTAALRSIYYVTWGSNDIHGIYPGGSGTASLKMDPLERHQVRDSNNKVRNVYNSFVKWYSGLCVRDFRHSGRICNIESDYMLAKSGQPDYLEIIDHFCMRPKRTEAGKQELLMAPSIWRDICTLMGRATRSNAISYNDVDQRRKQPHLFGMRVQLCDAMEVNEEAVASI